MKTKTLDFLSFLIALAGTVLAFADTQQPVANISPEIADKWPIVMGVALLLSRIARLVGDWLDDGKLNDSFKAGLWMLGMGGMGLMGLMAGLLMLTGCVNGRPAPWLNVQGCYETPDGTHVCAGVKEGSAHLTATKRSATGYAK